eukprot:20018-Eustigmatos_ZCMA.PRE.1
MQMLDRREFLNPDISQEFAFIVDDGMDKVPGAMGTCCSLGNGCCCQCIPPTSVDEQGRRTSKQANCWQK